MGQTWLTRVSLRGFVARRAGACSPGHYVPWPFYGVSQATSGAFVAPNRWPPLTWRSVTRSVWGPGATRCGAHARTRHGSTRLVDFKGSTMRGRARPVSYTHLRAHETDS